MISSWMISWKVNEVTCDDVKQVEEEEEEEAVAVLLVICVCICFSSSAFIVCNVTDVPVCCAHVHETRAKPQTCCGVR